MKTLSIQDYQKAALFLGCETAVVRAVAEVESSGSGFNPDGSPKILFEAHWFYRLTDGRFGLSNVSQRSWSAGRIFYRQNQHKRLQKAVRLDRNAALQSASWGRFQIMGFNYRECGFDSVQSFVNAMYDSERAQLMAFCRYIKHRRLNDELRDKEWAKFAYGYNGPGYRRNHYAKKLAAAYKRYS